MHRLKVNMSLLVDANDSPMQSLGMLKKIMIRTELVMPSMDCL